MTDLCNNLGFTKPIVLTKNNVNTCVDFPVNIHIKEKINTTVTGIWAQDQSITLILERIGDTVTMCFSFVFATANTSDNVDVTTLLPTAFIPDDLRSGFLLARDNGVFVGSKMQVDTIGRVRFFGSFDTGDFSGSGSSGFASGCFTYSVAA